MVKSKSQTPILQPSSTKTSLLSAAKTSLVSVFLEKPIIHSSLNLRP
jgi:hypothetical protein